MIFKDILNEKNSVILDDLLARCNSVKEINIEEIKKLAEQASKATNSGSKLPDKLNSILEQWYNSLQNNSPDYSVYGVDEYIAELWACWKVYSKTHLKNIQKSNSLITQSITSRHEHDQTIVDLGCGFAYTTSAIKQIFPNAKVWGTNLDGTLQMAVAKTMAADYGFQMAGDPEDITDSVDLIFASEYFEHFQQPIDHLDYVIETLNPKAFLIANAFGPRAIGHFENYSVKLTEIFEHEEIKAKSTGKMFNQRMKYHGYSKVKTKLWNNRPSYWVKL